MRKAPDSQASDAENGSIRTDMWHVTTNSITHTARAMGARLLDLRIYNGCIKNRYLCDGALDVVAEFCPNLNYFAYRISYVGCYKEEHDPLNGADIINLIRGCHSLEVLELQNAMRIKRDDFTAILDMIAPDDVAGTDGSSIFELRKIVLVEYPFVIRNNPFAII